MKDLNLLIWLTQLGLSVALPLIGFLLLGLWLREMWGQWVLILCIGIGLVCAFDGFRNSLKLMSRMAKDKKPDDPPAVSFNEHE